MYLFTWFILMFFLQLLGRNLFQTQTNYNRIIKNLAFGLINKSLSPLFVITLGYFLSPLSFFSKNDYSFLIVFNIIILDFFNYLFHRLSHTNPFLWRFHEIHHLDEHFDVTTGLRIHIGEIFFQSIFRLIPIILFQINFETILIFELLLNVNGIFHHTNILLPPFVEKFFSCFLVTPKFHAIHHHSSYKDWNSNYGFIFNVWDKLFNTLTNPNKKLTRKMGLGYSSDLGLVDLFISPFLFKKLRHRRRDKILINKKRLYV